MTSAIDDTLWMIVYCSKNYLRVFDREIILSAMYFFLQRHLVQVAFVSNCLREKHLLATVDQLTIPCAPHPIRGLVAQIIQCSNRRVKALSQCYTCSPCSPANWTQVRAQMAGDMMTWTTKREDIFLHR